MGRGSNLADSRNTGLLSFGDSEEIPAEVTKVKKDMSRKDCEFPPDDAESSGGKGPREEYHLC